MKPSMQTITGIESSSASGRLDVQVGRLLVRLGEELDPAGVARGHGVAVVVPDVDGRADRPVGEGHDDRQSQTGRVVDGFHHEKSPWLAVAV
jgi:hypothetical protein